MLCLLHVIPFLSPKLFHEENQSQYPKTRFSFSSFFFISLPFSSPKCHYLHQLPQNLTTILLQNHRNSQSDLWDWLSWVIWTNQVSETETIPLERDWDNSIGQIWPLGRQYGLMRVLYLFFEFTFFIVFLFFPNIYIFSIWIFFPWPLSSEFPINLY